MYPEQKPLHTSRSDDKILSFLRHTLSLEKNFSFFYYFLSHPNHLSTRHYCEGEAWSTRQWNIASAPEITSHYLCITHLECHVPSGGSCSSDVLPTFAACHMALPGYGWSSEGITPLRGTPAQPASQFVWCNMDTQAGFSIPRSRMLSLSGLTTVVSDSYLNITLTWSYVTENVIKILNYKF